MQKGWYERFMLPEGGVMCGEVPVTFISAPPVCMEMLEFVLVICVCWIRFTVRFPLPFTST